MGQYRLTVDNTVQPVTDQAPANWSAIVQNCRERGVLARLEYRAVFDYDALFLEGLKDFTTKEIPKGWLVLGTSKIISPWSIQAEVSAKEKLIGGIIG